MSGLVRSHPLLLASYSILLMSDCLIVGIMGYSRDKLPLVGPIPDQAGLWLLAGFTGSFLPRTMLI